jgi:preprotein translocase subunit SecF
MDFRGKNIDLVGKRNLWFGISGLLLLISIVSCLLPMNLGVDFRGGGQLKYAIPQANRPAGNEAAAFINATREALAPKGLDNAKIQIAGGDTLVIVTDATDSAELESQISVISGALKAQLGDSPQLMSRELVGPVIGRELKRNAFLGVFLGIVGIAAWIYIRYNFAGEGLQYVTASICSLLHDVIVLVGLFALVGKFDSRVEFDGTFIAALLTVIGYSMNDTVVIFDRIRENLRKRGSQYFARIVNESLLETMSRSINTGLTVIIMLIALLLWGGESVYGFVLAMLIGIVTGLYSSLFNASMILTLFHDRETKKLATVGAGSSTTAARPAAPVKPRTSAPSAPRTETESGRTGISSKTPSRKRF